MAFSLVECTRVDFLKVLFLLVVFLVRMWLAKALLRFTFPLAVTEKRLAAPLCVFIFGIFSPLFWFYQFIFWVKQS